jgi:hypothetical protein
MDNQARTRTKAKKPSTRPELKPISYEEIMGNAGMSGFVSFLDAAETEPAASTLADAPDVIVSDTVVESNTVKETTSVQERKTSTVYEPVTVAKTYTVPTQSFKENRRWRVKRARGVEDGHSLAEQEVYRTLWKIGAPEGDDPEANRTVRIGYDRLAGLVRLSWVTVKANLRSLERKLAIEVVAAEDSASREGKQYRVYSTNAILARRQSAGLLWVRRTRGVELLTDASGATPGETSDARTPFSHRT